MQVAYKIVIERCSLYDWRRSTKRTIGLTWENSYYMVGIERKATFVKKARLGDADVVVGVKT